MFWPRGSTEVRGSISSSVLSENEDSSLALNTLILSDVALAIDLSLGAVSLCEVVALAPRSSMTVSPPISTPHDGHEIVSAGHLLPHRVQKARLPSLLLVTRPLSLVTIRQA